MDNINICSNKIIAMEVCNFKDHLDKIMHLLVHAFCQITNSIIFLIANLINIFKMYIFYNWFDYGFCQTYVICERSMSLLELLEATDCRSSDEL